MRAVRVFFRNSFRPKQKIDAASILKDLTVLLFEKKSVLVNLGLQKSTGQRLCLHLYRSQNSVMLYQNLALYIAQTFSFYVTYKMYLFTKSQRIISTPNRGKPSYFLTSYYQHILFIDQHYSTCSRMHILHKGLQQCENGSYFVNERR